MANHDNTNTLTDHGLRIPRSGRRRNSRASQVVSRQNPCTTKICTWNVKTMYQAGKVHNVIKEMKRLKIEIAGISEARWTGTGQCMVDDHIIYYSGTSNDEHQHGVAIILNKEMKRHVNEFVPISERLMLIKINARPVAVNIIQVYAPTGDKSEDEVEEFYNDLSNIYRKLPKQDLTIVMGDFNAKIGQGDGGEFIGPYGLGERNERGDRLATFVAEEQVVILNTFFKLPQRRLYTWRSPMDSPGHVVRNQIDFLLVNKRYRNSFISVKTYPGADVMSDHSPVVGVVRLKLKKIRKKAQNNIYDIKKLKDTGIASKVKDDLTEMLQRTEEVNDVTKLKNAVITVQQKYLKADYKIKRKAWMTDEILQMMEKRRLLKNRKEDDYKRLHKQIKKKIRDAKEKEMQDNCRDIEFFQERYDNFNVHKKIRETTKNFNRRSICRLTDHQNNIIIDKSEKLKEWQRYIKELFEDARPKPPELAQETGPPITTDEVRSAIAQMKEGKAPGPDKIQSEVLALLDDFGIKWICTIFNEIYQTGNIPQQWLVSEFIAIPKKSGARKCEEYRTISLMSHLLKIFLKIIHKRIFRVVETQLSETQFGFRDAVGTREALFSIQVLIQRCRDVNCDVYACFIDYHKAFDRVRHYKLINLLKKIGLDDRDLRIISNLYWGQSAYMSVEGERSEQIEILRGVRQGCILSPLLFNLYSEEVFKEALQNVNEGILVNGSRLNNIRYADDTVILAENLDSLQELMTRVSNISHEYGLDLNVNKTKYMVISKNPVPDGALRINQQKIQRVNRYTYLGTDLNDQWDHSREIRCRIEKARAVYLRMAAVFRSRHLTLTTKMRLLRCYVFSVLFYGVESWTLTEASTKKLAAFEMWLYRRTLRISWVEHVTNEEVLRRMQKDTEIINLVKQRKLEYLGHVMRNERRYGLLQRILQGKILGRRGPGRRRISWLKNLRTWFSKSTTSLFRAAVDKVMIARMIANVRNGQAQ